jgi:hypothetical protein
MNIHKLGFVLVNPDNLETYPNFIPTIDDHLEQATILLLPLELSAKTDGVYPVLNCTCGEWGCGGYYVKVKNTPEHVIWEEFYALPNGEKKVKTAVHALPPICFERTNYESVITELLEVKDQCKWEANVYITDKEIFESKGLEALYKFK